MVAQKNIESGMVEKTLTCFGAASVIIGCMIGSGIFSNGYITYREVPFAVPYVALWVLGGLAAICGGLTWAEWALMIPANGGDTPYLEVAFTNPPKFLAFLYIWTRAIFANPVTLAALADVSKDFLLRSFLLQEKFMDSLKENTIKSYIISKSIAAGLLLLMFLGVAFSNMIVAKSQTVLSIFKQLLLLVLIIIGIVKAFSVSGIDKTAFTPTFNNELPLELSPGKENLAKRFDFGAFGSCLLLVLFCFDGFANLSSVVTELKNPKRDTLRAILIGTVSVTILYVIVNICYLIPFTSAVYISKTNTSFAVDYIMACMGIDNGEIVKSISSILFFISAFGAGLSISFAGSRVTQVGAIGGYLPFSRYLGLTNTKFGTPLNAIIFQTAISFLILLVPLGGNSFEVFASSSMYAAWILYTVSAFGLIVMRFKRPEMERPFKVFIGCPIVVICFGLFIMPICFFVPISFEHLFYVPIYGWGAVILGGIYYFIFLYKKFTLEKQLSIK